MIWVLYVMFMTEDRTLNSITEQRTFSSYEECNTFYTQNKKSLDESIVEMPIKKEKTQ